MYNKVNIFPEKLRGICIYILDREMATHSSIIAWEIPWTGEPGGRSPWGRKSQNMT